MLVIRWWFSKASMDPKIICKWLGIEAWPSDHYALLGLRPGERDVSRIERQVHERMAKLRCYQLAHPEEATEGMNRVAQAYICLTEALSKTNAEARQKNRARPRKTLANPPRKRKSSEN